MFTLFGRDLVARLLRGDLAVTDFYNRLSVTIAMIATAIVTVSFVSDVAGYNIINIMVIPVWAMIVMYFRSLPRSLEIVLAASTVASKVGLITSVKAGYEKWDLLTKHAILFGGVFGLTRFLVPIKAYPSMGLVILGGVIVIGTLAWIDPSAKVYKRYALFIALLSIGIALFGAFTGKPDKTPEGGAENGLPGIVGQITGNSNTANTKEVEVRNYNDQRICGLPAGKLKFRVPHPVYVILQNGTSRYLSEDIQFNGVIQGEEFEAGKGCATMSLSRLEEFKRSPNATIREPQRFRIEFYKNN